VDARAAFAYDAPTAVCDAWLVEGLAAAVARRGYPTLRLPSGPGHDAISLRGRIPFAVLSVRCRGWVSHNPTAYASPHDLDAVADVLADFIEHFVPARPLNVRRED
jgi:allantoate deiminase